jgi:acetate kinase
VQTLVFILLLLNIHCRLVMGTRSGDMDPAVPLHLMNTLGLSAKEMDTILNKKSGLLGVCGHNDLRAIIDSKVGAAVLICQR